MRVTPLVLLLASTTLLPACAGRLETTVRKRAAGDFQCAPEQVEVQTVSAGAMSGSYTASGCGQESEYAARCGLIGICSASRPGDEAMYASSEPDPGYGGGGGGGSAPPPSSDASEPSSTSSPPAGPTTVSITMRNACPQTVNLFFGEKPKFGSGTYSTIGTNTVTSKSMRPGEMIWIVDESQNGISSVTIEASTGTVEVTSDCSAFSVR